MRIAQEEILILSSHFDSVQYRRSDPARQRHDHALGSGVWTKDVSKAHNSQKASALVGMGQLLPAMDPAVQFGVQDEWVRTGIRAPTDGGISEREGLDQDCLTAALPHRLLTVRYIRMNITNRSTIPTPTDGGDDGRSGTGRPVSKPTAAFLAGDRKLIDDQWLLLHPADLPI